MVLFLLPLIFLLLVGFSVNLREGSAPFFVSFSPSFVFYRYLLFVGFVVGFSALAVFCFIGVAVKFISFVTAWLARIASSVSSVFFQSMLLFFIKLRKRLFFFTFSAGFHILKLSTSLIHHPRPSLAV